MSIGYEGTSDPRQSKLHSRTDTVWAVAPGEAIESDEQGTLSNELAGLSERVDLLCQRPIKWMAQIRDLGDPGYLLAEALMIVIEEYASEGSVIARFPEVEAFGEGETESEAILRLKEDILRLYIDLDRSSPDELGPMPESWLRVLRRVIIKE